jgi:DNA-binding beta-propeller fold protein YncE
MSRFTSPLGALLLALVAMAWLPGIMRADFLPGDIIVADRALNGVLKIDPITGAQTVISSGGFFTNLTGVAVSKNGDIYVCDQNAFAGGFGAIFRIDPRTGAQTTITSAGFFVHPQGLTVARNGDILVANDQGN